MPFKWPPKDPNERLDYRHNFGPRLDNGDAFDPLSAVAIVETGDVEIAGNPSFDAGWVKVWLVGGTVKESGEPEKLTLRISTVAGRTFDEGFNLAIRER